MFSHLHLQQYVSKNIHHYGTISLSQSPIDPRFSSACVYICIYNETELSIKPIRSILPLLLAKAGCPKVIKIIQNFFSTNLLNTFSIINLHSFYGIGNRTVLIENTNYYFHYCVKYYYPIIILITDLDTR